MYNQKAHLEATRTLLSDRSKWTTLVEARNKEGQATGSLTQEANCWCLLGALAKTSTVDSVRPIPTETRRLLQQLAKTQFLSEFNDTNDYKSVINLLDEAIKCSK